MKYLDKFIQEGFTHGIILDINGDILYAGILEEREELKVLLTPKNEKIHIYFLKKDKKEENKDFLTIRQYMLTRVPGYGLICQDDSKTEFNLRLNKNTKKILRELIEQNQEEIE